MATDASAALQALNGGTPMRQRRVRSQLSCTHCRQGKLKCDREQPCDQCVKRTRESTCSYLPPPKRTRTGQNVKSRINHLEQLVVELMSSKDIPTAGQAGTHTPVLPPMAQSNHSSASAMTPPSDADNSAEHLQAVDESIGGENDAYGQMTLSHGETSYVGDTHWTAILDSISDLKQHLPDDTNEDESGSEDGRTEDLFEDSPEGISSLLRAPVRRSKAELLRLLPPKDEIDRLLYQWFNASDPFKNVHHPPTFHKEYRAFWLDPTRTPTMWIGLLYGIMSVASRYGLRDIDDIESPSAQTAMNNADRYHELAASAAVLADYTSPKPYTLECLILYISGLASRNAFVDVWQLLGLTVRIALRMGYHRDPSHYGQFTAFQSEMRRRVWHSLFMIDVLLSFQMGLPSTVRIAQADTRNLGNYQDEDLSTDMIVLPPPRPSSEITPVSCGMTKAILFPVFSDIVELSHLPIPPSHDQVMELDKRLQAANSQVPSPLRLQPLAESLTVDPQTLMWRYNIALLVLKSKIVLHRRFMKSSQTGIDSSYSRRCCVEAAMQTLRYHHEISGAGQPGGQLQIPKWYMNSLSTHDFLLSAMILCVELSQRCDTPVSEDHAGDELIAREEDVIQLLEKSQKIWEESTSQIRGKKHPKATIAQAYKETSLVSGTVKAAKAMEVMVARVKARKSSGNVLQLMSTTGMTVLPGLSESWTNFEPTPPEWASTDTDLAMMDLSMMGDMINVPDYIDWELWGKISKGQNQPEMDLQDWTKDITMEPY